MTTKIGELGLDTVLSKIGVDEGTELYELIEAGFSLAPYIGKVMQYIKMKRFEQRLQEHESAIQCIESLLHYTKLPHDFIKERIFPIVLEDLLEEHEDNKIKYILNGFQNVLLEDLGEEDIVLAYFDTLRNLRYADVRRLAYYADVDEYYPDTMYFLGSQFDGLAKYIDSKLNNLFLIMIHKTWGAIGGDEQELSKEQVKLSNYGEHFMEFITVNEDNVQLKFKRR
ncbi:hypothetical protein [Brevibacillus sp. FIR094]|uniref:hypothetical protein n=1 Tax=Brevibacillus sp. FIR094 TaxID=3134809 RepID=UPI003D2040B1